MMKVISCINLSSFLKKWSKELEFATIKRNKWLWTFLFLRKNWHVIEKCVWILQKCSRYIFHILQASLCGVFLYLLGISMRGFPYLLGISCADSFRILKNIRFVGFSWLEGKRNTEEWSVFTLSSKVYIQCFFV